MASAALVPVAEYLRSSYEPDADLVDGRIEERVVGDREHSDLQRQLLPLLSQPGFKLSSSAIGSFEFKSQRADSVCPICACSR